MKLEDLLKFSSFIPNISASSLNYSTNKLSHLRDTMCGLILEDPLVPKNDVLWVLKSFQIITFLFSHKENYRLE